VLDNADVDLPVAVATPISLKLRNSSGRLGWWSRVGKYLRFVCLALLIFLGTNLFARELADCYRRLLIHCRHHRPDYIGGGTCFDIFTL
jgi:hypothetical protein